MMPEPSAFASRRANTATAPGQGRELIGELGCPSDGCAPVMDMAYEGDETRGLASLPGVKPVVPPNPQRLKPWRLDKA